MHSLNISLGSWRISISRALPDHARLVSMYDGTAWRWQPMIYLLGYTRAYNRLLADLAVEGGLCGLHGRSKVLDAGIGTGALTLALVRQMQELPELHGIDVSARMLARARNNLASLNQSSLSGRLRLGEISRLPYPDGFFDLVMSAHVIEHCPVLETALAELARVLRPGGSMLLVTSRANAANLLQGLRWRFRLTTAQAMTDQLLRAGLERIERRSLRRGRNLPGLLSEAYRGSKMRNNSLAREAITPPQ